MDNDKPDPTPDPLEPTPQERAQAKADERLALAMATNDVLYQRCESLVARCYALERVMVQQRVELSELHQALIEYAPADDTPTDDDAGNAVAP